MNRLERKPAHDAEVSGQIGAGTLRKSKILGPPPGMESDGGSTPSTAFVQAATTWFGFTPAAQPHNEPPSRQHPSHRRPEDLLTGSPAMVHHLYGDILHEFRRRHRDLVVSNDSSRHKAAVIVETRSAYFLPHVLTNAAYYLQDGWNLYVVHSPANESFVAECLRPWNVNTVTLNVPGLSTDQYNELLMSDQFWDVFREEWVLVFQTDCLFCRPVADEFFNYGYIGAPCGPYASVLNGGFSLRHRPLMKRAIKECRERIQESVEDVFFTRAAALLNSRVPDFRTACRFSVENFFVDIPVGVHGTDKFYLSEESVAALANHMWHELTLPPGSDSPA